MAKARGTVKTRKQPAPLPELHEITLYWIDERINNKPRVNEPHFVVASKQVVNSFVVETTKLVQGTRTPSCNRGTVFNPGVARLETRDIDKAIAWVESMLLQGWINEADLKERQTLMRLLIKASARTDYTPGVRKSGKGEKGSHKPTRDRWAPASVRGNGNPTGVVRMGRDFGPAKE